MSQRPRNRIGRPRIGLAGGVVALALGSLAITTWSSTESKAEAAQEADRSLAEIAMVDARSSIEWILLDEANALALRGVGVIDDSEVDAVVATRVATLSEALRVMDELADGEGSTAREAHDFLAVFAESGLDVDGQNDVSSVYDAAGLARYEERPGGLDERVEALHELSLIGAIPALILDEAIGGEVLVTGRAVDDNVAEFVGESAGRVQLEGGWLGATSSAPMSGLEFLDFERAVEFYPNQVARAEAVLAANEVVAIDTWVKSLSEHELGEPPSALAEMADRAARSTAELRAVFEDTKASESAVLQAAEAAAREQQRTLLALTLLIALLAAAGCALTVASVVQIARRSHRKAQLATVDSLTGIGNRHHLEERTRALSKDARFGQHLVAIVDLDRFKMINDVFGHAAGDAILVEVASQLTSCGRDIVEWFPGAEVTTIRLGGDEFLLSVHSSVPVDVDRVRERIESIRQRTIALGDEALLSLEFSLGVSSAGHLPNLSEMMGAADLAVYEDKSARAHLRAAHLGGNQSDEAQREGSPTAGTIGA